MGHPASSRRALRTVPLARPTIAVATCSLAPNLDEDGGLLLSALDAEGLDATVHTWDDPAPDWSSYGLVLVRSVWDYPLRRDAFLAWTRACRRTANPQHVLAWNTDKRYLDDLEAAGVPTVPRYFLAPGERNSWPHGDYVVKPSVSGGAADTGRFRHDDAAAQDLVDRLHAQGRTAMVQPYIPGIETDGETSLIYLGGVYSHAVRRAPLLTAAGVRTPVVVADVLATVEQVEATPAQRDVAETALAAVPGVPRGLSYARVDLVPGHDGPLVLELEATDCFLFLSFAEPSAVRRLTAHVAAAVRSS